MRFRYPTRLLVMTLLGCAASPKPVDAPAPTNVASPAAAISTIALEVKTVDAGASSWRTVSPGSRMNSGSEFSISVEVGHPVFLYVAQRDAANAITWLSPQGPETPLQASPNQLAQFPTSPGQWFRLDQNKGAETLFIAASAQRSNLELLTTTLRAQPAAAVRRDPPPLVTQNKRGLFGEHVVRTALPAEGIAILRFDYLHQ